MENIVKRQTNKKRPIPTKARAIKDKRTLRRSQPKQNYQFTLSLTADEIELVKERTKFLKGVLGIKRSEVLRKVLLRLIDKKLLNELGFEIRKKY